MRLSAIHAAGGRSACPNCANPMAGEPSSAKIAASASIRSEFDSLIESLPDDVYPLLVDYSPV
jgi:hypothetical protein